MNTSTPKWLTLISSVLLLTACGNPGALYLPAQKAQPSSTSQPSAPQTKTANDTTKTPP